MSLNIDGSPSKKEGNIEGSPSKKQGIRPLVSIDYVRVEEVNLKIDVKEKPYLVGSVIVTDCLGDVIVYYNRFNYMKRQSLQMPLPQEISMGTLGRPISGDGRFVISVYFWVLVGDREPIATEIAKGGIVWDPNQLPYDEPRQQVVPGEYGSVRVGFSVIREALNATIDVVWINEPEARLYGTIKANVWINEPEARLYGTIKAVNLSRTRVLFDVPDAKKAKEVHQHLSMLYAPYFDDGERFHFPVQTGSLFIIEVELWDRFSPNQSIVGSVQFTPKIGKKEVDITGTNGRQVRVSIAFE